MATATLGGLIKDYRLRKRLSQLEVSISMGWSDSTRLSKIEQGRVGKPNRNTVEKIMDSLNLTDQERGEFLLVGGYVPTDVEIRKAIKEIRPMIDRWPYPAYVLDFTWRLVYINNLGLHLFGLGPSWKNKIRKTYVNVLSFPFLPKNEFPVYIEQGEDRNNLTSFATAQIAAFKKDNHLFQGESWYNKLTAQLMKYPEFRRVWPSIDERQHFKYKKMYEYEYKRITSVQRGKRKVFEFHVFLTKMYDEPRFMGVMYIPANKEAEKFCKLLSNI